MSAKFKQRIRDGGGAEYVTLSGVLDEDNELESLADKLATSKSIVVLLLGRVERINEVGATAFADFLDGIRERRARVVLVDCSPAVVAQLNALTESWSGLAIKSFEAPYFCPECDEPRTIVCEATNFDGPPPSPPVKRCPECDYVMQFDDDAGTYFAFLSIHSERVDDALAKRIVDHRISTVDESTAPGQAPESEVIPRAPRRAPTATGPIDRVRALPPWLVVAAILLLGAIVLYVLVGD